MVRDELLSLVQRVGREFHRRQMRDHLRNLRLYWLALHRGLLAPGTFRLRVDWSAELTLEWARLLGLPGTTPYPVRPRGALCVCQSEAGHPVEVHTLMVLPNGRKVRCQRCGTEWVERSDEPPPSRCG